MKTTPYKTILHLRTRSAADSPHPGGYCVCSQWRCCFFIALFFSPPPQRIAPCSIKSCQADGGYHNGGLVQK